MSIAAASLAERFEAAYTELIALVEGCSPEEWQRPCPNDGRSVGVVAHHVAEVNPAFIGIVGTLAAGEPFGPVGSMDDVDAENERHAAEQAAIAQADVLDLLQTHGPAMVELVRGLSDEQLAGTTTAFPMGEVTLAQVVEWIVIGHTAEHLASIRTALTEPVASESLTPDQLQRQP